MYNQHFGLREAPFSIAPNPQYLYMSQRHREALAHLLYGVQSDGGFILLTGEVGTGKTTLCRCLLEQVPADVETAFVLNPRVTVKELLATICDEFAIDCPKRATLKTLLDKLNVFLLECHGNHKKAVLIIDEAQNLDRNVLEQLRLLTNLETNERKLLQIILLGQPELLDMLAKKNLRQFTQRITARFHLDTLSQPETADYVAHRLIVAGARPEVFSERAVRRIYRISKGTPRIINLICDRALLGAYVENRQKVTAAIAARAAREVLGMRRRKPVAAVATVAAAAVSAIAAGAAFWWYSGRPSPEPLIALPDADPPPEAVAAPPLLRGHADLSAAYHDLFALWGMAFEDKSTDPCELAQTIGLQCHRQKADLTTLTLMNRPAIVFLDNQYLTLSSLDGNRMTLFAGENQFELTSAEFNGKYTGEVNLMLRTPEADIDTPTLNQRN